MEGFSLDERMERNMINQQSKELLKGLRVLELGTLIAGPFAGRMFADFGADVIKVETPKTGDLIRKWRAVHEGTSLRWYVQARNKKSLTVNLTAHAGTAIIKEIAKHTDVILDNFRHGTS